MSEQIGKVYLVGAGPGDIAYLTLRAQKLLTQAEVLVYDALVDTQLLQLVPPACRQFNVGKRGGRPSNSQANINQLLVEQCQQGKKVVRLKSGDPFIFGRAASEIQALIAAGCTFEVVPGISSALAAPLLASIPLSDPVLSKCFAVLSAHQPSELDWEGLVRIDTLVFLMGGRNLEEIVRCLRRHGLSKKTPVAVIRACGRLQQQLWIGTLADIVEQTAGISLSPAVIVIGEVVGLHHYLQSPEFEEGVTGVIGLEDNVQSDKLTYGNGFGVKASILKGKTILVTRSAGQSSKFAQLLQDEGARVIEMPALVIGPPSNWEGLDNAINCLSDFDWLILTSTNGVDYFFERLWQQGKDTRALAAIKIAVVGRKTAASLKEHNLQPDFIPSNFVADSLIAEFPETIAGKKVLFPRVETGGREVLVKEMHTQGAIVTEVAAYESRCPEHMASAAQQALEQQEVDVITFASSKTVKNFVRLVEISLQWQQPLSQLEGICIASIGPQTSITCRQLLGRVDIEAGEYTLEGLTQGIIGWAVQSHRTKEMP
ncbi:MAG: uroporphyrinogen-III C-methyltransferase [Symploca sp. SIO2B6]|nr:uroporphyrinogen-III C-methyltransferase [Symploca sp. SIO2B6]